MHLPSSSSRNPPTLASLPSQCDVLVVGGGINGAGIARDLAGRGVGVVLVEQHDLAAHTSSASTKLIHGGLRYLEHYEFALVRKALAEREVLLKSAPHIMRPLRFVMPHDPGMRPAWMIRAGLFLYDHLARREVLSGSRVIRLAEHAAGAPLKKVFTQGFIYSDGWVDDARLVVLCAVDAAARGAVVATRCACVDAQRQHGHWRVQLRGADGRSTTLQARALVNAAGPWASRFLSQAAHVPTPRGLRLVKGSHIIVPQLFAHEHAYIFQNPDQRIIFAIPYEGAFTLIGTTDIEHHGEPGQAQIDGAEVDYLCRQASRYFERRIAPRDVVWTYSGVRPLLDDDEGNPSAVTRDYSLELDAAAGAPLLNVWGGKLTTFRKLAEEAADGLAPRLGSTRAAWTADAALPGGDLSGWIGAAQRPDIDLLRFTGVLQQRWPGLAPALAQRLARCYGARVDQLLPMPRCGVGGAEVAPGLYESELHYLHAQEWARGADDVLWRRTKLGLHYDAATRAGVAAWCERAWGTPPSDAERAGVAPGGGVAAIADAMAAAQAPRTTGAACN